MAFGLKHFEIYLLQQITFLEILDNDDNIDHDESSHALNIFHSTEKLIVLLEDSTYKIY